LKAIDFFCGAGGLTRGLSLAGIDVIAGIDIDSKCGQTYAFNNTAEFWNADVASITKQDIINRYPDLTTSNESILFAGCAPCQPFSKQRRSRKDEYDRKILLQFGRIIEEFKPSWVLVENVPGISHANKDTPINEFLNILGSCKYNFVKSILNAKEYGVPQNRYRFVLIASRNCEVSLPLKTHGHGLRAFKTVRDTISKYPPIAAGHAHPTLLNHVSASLSDLNHKRMINTPPDGGDRRCWPEKLVLRCHKSYKGHTDVYGRMFWDKPAPTLTSKCISISNGRFGHPVQNRAISLREAAALQGFPDNYIFFGSLQSIARQIGNSVPVQLAKILGQHIVALDVDCSV
jgi:DNA (cytosine-5)-methyltransferase 1